MIDGETQRKVYVASSWRCERQPVMVGHLQQAGHEVYDFRHPPGGTGFSWKEVGANYGLSEGESADTYLEMVGHPRAVEGYEADYAAMEWADTFVLVLPCNRSAHLELGWAVGSGRRTAILLEDPMEPELMYRMVNFMSPYKLDIVGWVGGSIPDNG